MSELSKGEMDELMGNFIKQTGLEKTYTKAELKQAKLEVADMYIGIVKALAESGDAQCAVNLAKQLKQQIESE